jgi:excisionase family DNA binding protein
MTRPDLPPIDWRPHAHAVASADAAGGRRYLGADGVPGGILAGGAEPPRDRRLLLSVADAAELLGISRTKAYELVLARRLPTVKIGRLRKVRPDDLKAFIAGLPDA